mgnify:CR=1 FL=1
MAPSPQDSADRRLSLILFLAILATLIVVVAVGWFVLGPAIVAAVEPGVGLRTAALIAFGLSLVVIVVMAIAAGDGLLGELPAMLLGFFAFFLIAWLMIAWIF